MSYWRSLAERSLKELLVPLFVIRAICALQLSPRSAVGLSVVARHSCTERAGRSEIRRWAVNCSLWALM